ncbi:MAG: flagellar assembly protein FliW [Vulcanimicrobiaceae bacterium]
MSETDTAAPAQAQADQITVTLPRFGDFTYAEQDVIRFPWGLPGFALLRRWLAVSLPSQPNFVWLQSLDDLNVALPTADPWLVFESYDPKLPPYAVAALEIRDAGEFTILCVVVVTGEAQEMTMNLLAPIVVNLRTRLARQIMLENAPYSVREPMPRTAPPASEPAKA